MNTRFIGQVVRWAKALLPALMLTGNATAATSPSTPPTPVVGDYVIKGFTFTSGETLPELRIHYLTLGKPSKDARGMVRNAVLIGHGTGGSAEGFLRPQFAGELFGPGQPLDATKYFIVMPDGIGHGKSSKPSDGLHARFPHYGYTDMVTAQFRLLTEGLGVNHARLVMGTSMGGMHTWVWGEQHPDFVDALMPLASLPAQVAGRNRAWRLMGIEAIRNDPEWHGGDYQKQPAALKTVAGMLWFVSSNPVVRQRQAPTLAQADQALEVYVADFVKTNDANDIMYALDASHDYDPGPLLEKIQVPLVAVNSADDLINPPELGILEREIKRVPHGRAVVIPLSDRTAGHQTHSLPAIWKGELERLLRESAATNDVGSKVSN
ncbi:MAG TPA: alpha/beta fold hydrolase [Steroidobacteraceae bacterium]|nr:alpha/beta fold hydrolase [Steroidobacteraceae bacterium]